MSARPQRRHLETIEIETRPSPSHSIIWLHGLGADGNDFVPVVEQLQLPKMGIRFIFPHAPMIPVTVNGGFVMRAWYDIVDADFSARAEDEAGVRTSQAAVAELIDAEIARGIPASRIVLAGFSQGGAITLQTGLRYPDKLAGLLALSAYLPLMSALQAEGGHANRLTPVFMGHGSDDNIVPVSLGAASRDYLTQHGYRVEWHEYRMVHSVCDEELADVSVWLNKLLV